MRRWYAGGLRFSCLPDCHACCRRPGAVYLRFGEIEAMADYLGMTPKVFRERFVERLDSRHISLSWDPFLERCVLWNDGCSVYPVRPSQCSGYPFWPEFLRSRERWMKEANFCPGMNQGLLHGEEEIQGLISRR